MAECNPTLPNLGSGDCKLQIGLIRRICFVSQKKEDNSKNTISLATAVALATWQALFDIPGFETNPLEKIVPSDKIYLALSEQEDPVTYDEDGYYKKLKDGNYNITFQLNELYPDKIRAYKELELANVAVWLIDADGKIWGIKNGVNLDPIPLLNFAVENFNLQSTEIISKEAVVMRLENSEDMNALTYVELASGNPLSESDFYSLIDVDTAISTPAVTGCIVTLDTERYDEAVTGFVFGDFIFYGDTAPTGAITLAGAGSLTEVAGVYTVNESSLLTTGHTYTLKIRHDGYDVATGSVVVP